MRWFIPIIIVVWIGCDMEPMGQVDDRSPALYGIVLDEAGLPLSEVSVHYIPKLVPAEQASCFQSAELVLFGYTVTEVGPVSISARNYGTNQIVQTMVNQSAHPVGEYVALLQTQNLTNGPYSIDVALAGTEREISYLIIKPLSGLSPATPLTKSDTFGKFQIPFDRLGIGETFTKPGPSGISDCAAFISSSIDIVLIASGFPISVAPVELGSAQAPVDVTFTVSESEL